MLTCPFHWLTGLNCPLCGAQRMGIALWHGHISEAFWLNPGLFIGLPVAVAWWLRRRELSSHEALILLVVALGWGVFRNIVQL